MKIILSHNYYGSSSPSGENQVVEAEMELLLKHGHNLKMHTRHSDDIRSQGIIGSIRGALSTPWNPYEFRNINEKVRNFKPDLVHVHNTFPLLSPAIFHSIGGRAARVLTIHNYRIFCPSAIFLRNSEICTECIDKKFPFPAVINGCYRNSRLATLPLAFNVYLHKILGTWKNQVDAFITLTEFQKELMIKAGLPREKVFVKPNFFPGKPKVKPWSEHHSYVVYAGRLSEEKGVLSLLNAWRDWGPSAPELRIIGDGKLRPVLEKMAYGLPISFLGTMSKDDTLEQISLAKLLILPSECFETFGLVAIEAFAHGVPVAVSNIGSLSSIVQHGRTGIVFQPSNPLSLLHEVKKAWHTPKLLESLGLNAYAEFESKYTEKANYLMLMEIYNEAIKISQHKQC